MLVLEQLFGCKEANLQRYGKPGRLVETARH